MGRTTRAIFDALFERRLGHNAQLVFRAFHALRPLKRPIFIIGLNRSGTSVFTRLMGSTCEIANWSEANEMWDPVGYPWEEGKTARPFWPVDPQGYTDSVLSSVPKSYFRSIPGMCSMYTASVKGSVRNSRFMNKSPMNALRVGLIEELFPDACYVSIVRDPRAVVRSRLHKIIPKLEGHIGSGIREDDSGRTIYDIDGHSFGREELILRLAQSWVYVISRQIRQISAIPGDRTYYTRYEDFAADVHTVLREADAKFGLDPAGRDWSGIPEKLENMNFKYKQELSDAEIDTITTVCKDTMSSLGYVA